MAMRCVPPTRMEAHNSSLSLARDELCGDALPALKRNQPLRLYSSCADSLFCGSCCNSWWTPCSARQKRKRLPQACFSSEEHSSRHRVVIEVESDPAACRPSEEQPRGMLLLKRSNGGGRRILLSFRVLFLWTFCAPHVPTSGACEGLPLYFRDFMRYKGLVQSVEGGIHALPCCFSRCPLDGLVFWGGSVTYEYIEVVS